MTQEPTALTIADFCAKYRINRATYYRNAKIGRMPPAIKVGGSTRILIEDEQAWLAKQRAEGLVCQGGRVMPKRRPPFVTDEISELDWLWFTQNPKVRERIRRPYPREIEKYGDTDICVYKQSSRCMYRYPVIFGLKED